MNANECLVNVNNLIKELEDVKKADFWSLDHTRYYWIGNKRCFKISAIYDECGIFDWWKETLSLSQLKQMQSFLKTAIKIGYTGYVCFKVGAAYCSHGMWAHKNESKDGYSPDGACLFHSFRSGDNYWDACDDNGVWMNSKPGFEGKYEFTLSEVKEAVA